MIEMQETPDAIPEGETPHTVTLFCFDDLVYPVSCHSKTVCIDVVHY